MITDTTIFGAFFAIIAILSIIPLTLGVLLIIGMWKTINKTGEEGWKSLIPIYNLYTLCTKIGVYKYWPLILLVLGLFNVVPVIGQFISIAGGIYFAVIFNVSLARSFGKDEGFAVGLILLAPIFYLILGGKEAKYIGPNPMDDPVMKYVNENILKTEQSPAQSEEKPVSEVKEEVLTPEENTETDHSE